MNGQLHRLRLVATLASIFTVAVYIATGRTDVPTLLALIGWNLTCLGLYRWQPK
jgi:hypothetical protein